VSCQVKCDRSLGNIALAERFVSHASLSFKPRSQKWAAGTTLQIIHEAEMQMQKYSPKPVTVANQCLCAFVRYRSKYFRNRKVFGDWDLRVEQVALDDLFLLSTVLVKKSSIHTLLYITHHR